MWGSRKDALRFRNTSNKLFFDILANAAVCEPKKKTASSFTENLMFPWRQIVSFTLRKWKKEKDSEWTSGYVAATASAITCSMLRDGGRKSFNDSSRTREFRGNYLQWPPEVEVLAPIDQFSTVNKPTKCCLPVVTRHVGHGQGRGSCDQEKTHGTAYQALQAINVEAGAEI